MYGNFGQSSYSAAKMGILGLTNTLAREGEKHNIRVNCVVPIAGSRMTETVLPQAMLELLDPIHVAPMVAYLAHESSTVNGEVFEVGGGWYSQVRLERSAGISLGGKDCPTSMEKIAENLEVIRDFRVNATNPSTPADAIRDMMAAATNASSSSPSSSSSSSSSSTPVKETIASPADPNDKIIMGSDIIFKALQTHIISDTNR